MDEISFATLTPDLKIFLEEALLKGRLSTIDLLIKVACFVKKEIIFSIL
jgi:hypothetical protein